MTSARARGRGGGAWRIRSARPGPDHHDHDRTGPEPADPERPGRRAWLVPTPGTRPSAADRPDGTAVDPGAEVLVSGFARALVGNHDGGMARHEHGDRQAFLEPARRRLADGIRANRVHPPPPALDGREPPVPRLAGAAEDLVGWFARTLEEAGATCHLADGDVPDTLLDRLVAEHEAWQAVVSGEPEARAVGDRLARRGVEVGPATTAAAARATIGVTSASAGIAATGSVVLDSSRTGSRGAGVLPPVHVCILPAERIVTGPSEVLRPLSHDPATVPPSLVLVTGPSRSGDIEQILTVGAHGPAELHVVVIDHIQDGTDPGAGGSEGPGGPEATC